MAYISKNATAERGIGSGSAAPLKSEAPPRASVVVVGLGYVGLPLALMTARHRKKFQVSGIDIDPGKCAEIAAGVAPDLDADLAAELAKTSFPVSTDWQTIHEADIVVICVPTPVMSDDVTGNHVPDLSFVMRAVESVAFRLKRGALVILESTVHPGTSDELVIPKIEEKSGLIAGVDFEYAHCPERINPGDTVWQPKKIPRVVGGITKNSTVRAAEFYRSILNAPVKEMATIREAEAVKMVENAFRDINIAFVNELAMSFSKLGIDVEHVLDGAATKPFSFMRHAPGCGVGGHCIPVDPYYLIQYAADNGFQHRFLSVAREVNNTMPYFTVSLLEKALAAEGKMVAGSRIALLGLAYKANIGDMRESPAFVIAAELTDRGAVIQSFDPHVPDLSTAGTLEEALRHADAVVLATAHAAFSDFSPALCVAEGIKIVVDGRNVLPKEAFKEAGVRYVGIGR